MTTVAQRFVPREPYVTLGKIMSLFVRARYPHDTAKSAERAWHINSNTSSNLIRGHASERTITKALRAEGWDLLMFIGEKITGESYTSFLERLADEQQQAAARASERGDRLRNLEARARHMRDVLDGRDAE